MHASRRHRWLPQPWLRRPWWMVVALLASAPAFAAQAWPAPVDDVRREWLAREWALFPRTHERAIGEALSAASWHERLLALEALARTPEGVRLAGERWLAAVDAALLEAHPNVRAAALELRARIAPRRPLAETTLAALAADPWPGSAEALAAHLGRSQAASDEPLEATAILLELAAARDPLVAERARLELLGAGPAAWRAQLDWITAEDPERRLVGAFVALARTGAAPELLVALRGWVGERVDERPGLAALVEALAWRAGADFDRERLAAGWAVAATGVARLEPSRAHGLRVELARTARLGDARLGRSLLERAAALASADSEVLLGDPPLAPDERAAAASLLVEAGSDALAPADAVEQARGLPLELARSVWEHVARRARSWEAASVAAWLAPEVPSELRKEVARAVHDAFDRTGDAGSEALLVELLRDPDPGLRRLAFRWLCAEEGLLARLERMRVAWLECAPEERLERLRWLPRSTPPLPFRGDLIELAERSATRTPSVIELLALFEGDVQLARAIEGWLDDELDTLASTVDLASFQAHEWRAKGLVRALGRVAGPAANVAIAAALQRSIGFGPAPRPMLPGGRVHRPEIPKTCAYWLGRSVAGREVLESYLDPAVPSRVRIEAALALAVDGVRPERAARALARLLEDWTGCDPELRARILRACGRSDDASAARFLESVARDSAGALAERVAAVSALAVRADVPAIERVLGACQDAFRDWDVLRACLHSLAELRSDTAREVLLAWVQASTTVPGDEEAAQLARDGLAALAASGPLPPARAARALVWPRRAAPADLTARFGGERLPAAEFRWRSELELAAYAAGHSALGDVLAACPDWWGLDARLLLLLGQAARSGGEPATARELLRGAWVGLLAEPPSRDRDERVGAALLELFAIAGEEHDWEAFVFWCDEWLAFERRGHRAFGVFERDSGSFDPHGGVDPHARLVSARAQARAWAALERGDSERAAVLTRRAALRVRGSASARTAQEALEAALAGAR